MVLKEKFLKFRQYIFCGSGGEQENVNSLQHSSSGGGDCLYIINATILLSFVLVLETDRGKDRQRTGDQKNALELADQVI